MRVAIVGGDKRMLYAAEAFLQSGEEVRISGFDEPLIIDKDLYEDYADAAAWADMIVLPVRPLSGENLNAPLSEKSIRLTRLGEIAGQKPVFSGFTESIRPCFNGSLYDYTACEEFSIRNAVLTAEGTISLLIGESERSLFGAKVLVLGYGRIGRVLSRYLKALGAQVAVAVRRKSACAWAEAEGYGTCDYSIKELNCFDYIVNTVPAPVLNAEHLAGIRTDSLLVDLASAPGGVDRKQAQEHGVRCIHALALPGRTAPAAAGRIIKDTICNIIKEENGGKDHSGLCDDRLLLHL